MEKRLTNFFEEFIKKEPIFLNKKILQSSYIPDSILHRDKQIEQIAQVLAPSLKLDKPSNLFIYGKTGSGKTVSIKYASRELLKVANKKSIPIRIVYLNCKLKKIADTEYRLISHITREFGKEIPPTGLPTYEIYKIFFNTINNKKQIIILVLDEIDQLVKKTGDEVLYNLTRINEDLTNTQISLIGISNDLRFIDNIDPRIKSSLSEEELVFPPYNAIQIQNILKDRAKKAFKKGAITNGVIEKCAAYAAREHGDARRALELLRVAGEIAERNNNKKIELKHLDEAQDKIEHDRIVDAIRTQPKQFQTVLYSILNLFSQKKEIIFTGEIYELYKKICQNISQRPLTQRRVSDVIAELDMLGIINAKVISKGRYGRTREISVPSFIYENQEIKSILEEGLGIS